MFEIALNACYLVVGDWWIFHKNRYIIMFIDIALKVLVLRIEDRYGALFISLSCETYYVLVAGQFGKWIYWHTGMTSLLCRPNQIVVNKRRLVVDNFTYDRQRQQFKKKCIQVFNKRVASSGRYLNSERCVHLAAYFQTRSPLYLSQFTVTTAIYWNDY